MALSPTLIALLGGDPSKRPAKPQDTPSSYNEALRQTEVKPPPENVQHHDTLTHEEATNKSGITLDPTMPTKISDHALQRALKNMENDPYSLKDENMLNRDPSRTANGLSLADTRRYSRMVDAYNNKRHMAGFGGIGTTGTASSTGKSFGGSGNIDIDRQGFYNKPMETEETRRMGRERENEADMARRRIDRQEQWSRLTLEHTQDQLQKFRDLALKSGQANLDNQVLAYQQQFHNAAMRNSAQYSKEAAAALSWLTSVGIPEAQAHKIVQLQMTGGDAGQYMAAQLANLYKTASGNMEQLLESALGGEIFNGLANKTLTAEEAYKKLKDQGYRFVTQDIRALGDFAITSKQLLKNAWQYIWGGVTGRKKGKS